MRGDGIRDGAFRALSRHGFFGWTMVGVGALGYFASGPGQSHNFGVFVGPLAREIGLSNAAVASAYGIATLAAAFALPWMGKLIDRVGPRRMMSLVGILLGLACMLFGTVMGVVSLALGFAALRFLGQGSLMMVSANLVAQWFRTRRGFAMGLVALGFALSMAVHPLLGQFLIEEIGWRSAWVVLGLATWLMLLPPVFLLVHNRPEDRGLAPDGVTMEADAQNTRQIDGLNLAEALRTPAFYIIAIGWFSVSMLVTTLHFHQVTILASQGVEPAIAVQMFSLSAVSMVLAMPFVGWLFDSMRTRIVFAGGLLIMVGSLAAASFARDATTAMLYAMLFGLNNAFSLTTFGYIVPRYFGRRHLGNLQGTAQMIAVVGASLGPLPVGMAFDLIGNAQTTLRLLALFPLGCAAWALFLKTPAGVTYPRHLE